jgi:hypothetical protein
MCVPGASKRVMPSSSASRRRSSAKWISSRASLRPSVALDSYCGATSWKVSDVSCCCVLRSVHSSSNTSSEAPFES